MSAEEFIMLSTYILAGIIGLCVGSFLNVVIYRLPNGMNLAKPDSHCTTCDYMLKWYDNIPVLSYIILGGKCRKCKQKISPRYMLVEIFNALLWLLCVYLFWEKSIVYAVACAIVSSTLICIFFVDIEHMLIMDSFNVTLGLAGIVAIFFDDYTVWYDHLIGAAVFGGLFLAIYYIAILIYKKEGLGFGDVKLAFAAGLFLGWQRVVPTVFIASVSAALVLVLIKAINRDEREHEYPFGPFIAVGILLSMLFGAPIMDWYLSLIL